MYTESVCSVGILEMFEFEKRDLIWRPLKNTLLLWSKKNGFSFVWIFEKLQYFFVDFDFCVFCNKKIMDFETFLCKFCGFCMRC